MLKLGRYWPWKTVSSPFHMPVRPMLLHPMALVSFRLFCKNLGNLQEFFWPSGLPPLPRQKIVRTPIRGVARIFSEVRTIFQITLHPHTLPPPQKKLSWWKIWLRCKSNSFFPHIMTLATYEILWRVFGSVYWRTSIICHIAYVQGDLYTGYYHAIRLHTFLVSLLHFFILGSFRRF